VRYLVLLEEDELDRLIKACGVTITALKKRLKRMPLEAFIPRGRATRAWSIKMEIKRLEKLRAKLVESKGIGKYI